MLPLAFQHRELQDMSREVLQSVQVNYAVQAFNAFHSRNYAKFFAVVRQVDFLQSAILHRYFDTVSEVSFCIVSKKVFGY